MSILANYILCIVFLEDSLTTVIKIQDVLINWPEIPKNLTYRNREANTQRCSFAHHRNKDAVLLIMGEGNGNPLQYSCLENPMGRGAW